MPHPNLTTEFGQLGSLITPDRIYRSRKGIRLQMQYLLKPNLYPLRHKMSWVGDKTDQVTIPLLYVCFWAALSARDFQRSQLLMETMQ